VHKTCTEDDHEIVVSSRYHVLSVVDVFCLRLVPNSGYRVPANDIFVTSNIDILDNTVTTWLGGVVVRASDL